jgi:hypothetical protein
MGGSLTMTWLIESSKFVVDNVYHGEEESWSVEIWGAFILMNSLMVEAPTV